MNENLMTVYELINYLPETPSIFTVYSWTKDKKIPFSKYGKKLFFDKNLIDKWNNEGRPIQAV